MFFVMLVFASAGDVMLPQLQARALNLVLGVPRNPLAAVAELLEQVRQLLLILGERERVGRDHELQHGRMARCGVS